MPTFLARRWKRLILLGTLAAVLAAAGLFAREVIAFLSAEIQGSYYPNKGEYDKTLAIPKTTPEGIPFYESATPIEVLTAFAGDGTMLINDTTRPDGYFNCTGIGSWKPIGPMELAATFIVFCRDFEQNLLFYEKPCLTMTLSKDGNYMEGTGVIYIYVPGQDPLDPEEVPVFEISIPITGQRILVE